METLVCTTLLSSSGEATDVVVQPVELAPEQPLLGLDDQALHDQQRVNVFRAADPLLESVEHKRHGLLEDGHEEDHDFVLLQAKEVLAKGVLLDHGRREQLVQRVEELFERELLVVFELVVRDDQLLLGVLEQVDARPDVELAWLAH